MKRIKIFLEILIFLAISLSSVKAVEFINPTGGAVISHDARHTGVDIYSIPNEQFRSPINGEVIRIEKDPVSVWKGLIIKGEGADTGYSIRALGVEPLLRVGDRIKKGGVLGKTQDPRKEFKDIKPYIHIEIYEDGKRINPTEFVTKRLPDRPIINAGSESKFEFTHNLLVTEAGRLAENGKHEAAIEKYLESLKYPSWETTNTYVMHYIADNYAKLGDFDKAVAIQQKMINTLKLELDYSLGNLPSEDLGVIAAVNSEQSLRILIGNHSLNLEAYKAKEQTVIHY